MNTMSNLILTPQQVATLAAALAPTREQQATAMSVSRPQLQRYLKDGVTMNCSHAIRAHLSQLAKDRGII